MDNWPPQHRTALTILLLALLATGGVYFFVIRPRAVEVADVRDGCEDLSADLKKATKETQYPLDAERLQTMLNSAKSRLDGVRRKRSDGVEVNTGLVATANRVLERATGMFDERIKSEYTEVGTFMNQVSRIIYRDELDRLRTDLQGKRVYLDDQILGIGEDSDTEETYQLLLKIWTVERLVDILVNKNRLAIQTRRLAPAEGETNRIPFGMRGGRSASEITVLPTKAYILHEDDKEPYILEFPIRVRFSGTVDSVCEAISDLQKDGNFLTANRFVLEAESPPVWANRSPDKDGILRARTVTVMLEVSSYFRPSGHKPTIRKDKVRLLPAGA
jgi:hypothetical protein